MTCPPNAFRSGEALIRSSRAPRSRAAGASPRQRMGKPPGRPGQSRRSRTVCMATSPRHRVVIVGVGLRRALRREVPAAGAGRGDAHRPDEPPPLPAAAVPGGDRHPLAGRHRACRRATSCASTTTSRSCSARSPGSTSTRARWRRRGPTGARSTLSYDSLDRRRRGRAVVLRPRRVRTSGRPG